MPLTRSSMRQPNSLSIDTLAWAVIFSPFSYNSGGSISPLTAPGPATPTTPASLHAPPHCACGCHRRNANIFDSLACALNLCLSRTREELSALIHECVRVHFSRNANNPLLYTDPTFTPPTSSDIRAWMLEAAEDVMDYEVKREVSLLSERLRQRILEHVEEEIEEAWHVKLHPVEAKKESQQTLEVDEEMPSPGLSEMSESLSSVSLGAPAPATPMPRTRQERRDSPALALNDRARRTRTSERLAERMHVIDEDPKDKLNAMNSNDRKQLKRKHEGFLDQAEEATSAKKPKSKKLRLV